MKKLLNLEYLRWSKSTSMYTTNLGVKLLLLYAFAIAVYVLARYRGLWGEHDTSVFSQAIESMLNSRHLLTPAHIYPKGYGYQALIVFFSSMSGIPALDIQLYASSLMFIWLVIPVWLLYRELTKNNRIALLSCFLLFIQPEFLFTSLRGTHEKFTRGLMLLCMYLLVRSLRDRSNLVRFTGFVIAFYICVYGMVSFNNFFSTSFVIALGFSLLLVAVFSGDIKSVLHDRVLARVCYVMLASIILAFIFTFYIYPPASQTIQILQSVWDRIAVLLLNMDTQAYNPYTTVEDTWINLPTYFVLSLANWLILVGSATIWLGQSMRWWLGKWRPVKIHQLILWSMYGAFAIQGALSVLVDVSGAIAGNLQLRIFPSFIILATPVVAIWLAERKFLRYRQAVQIAFCLFISFLAISSIIKATNEPLVSNKWLFVSTDELQAVQWADEYLPEQRLWVGYDERILAATIMREGDRPQEVKLTDNRQEESVTNLLISDIILLRGKRLQQMPPLPENANIIYDNGSTQIYQSLPNSESQ